MLPLKKYTDSRHSISVILDLLTSTFDKNSIIAASAEYLYAKSGASSPLVLLAPFRT